MPAFDDKIIKCPGCGEELPAIMKVCPYCGLNTEQVSACGPERFMHPSDRKALGALKAIPGFTPLLKYFMSIWNERQYRLLNMSSRIKLSEEQMPEIYSLLPPICEKLGIEVPEMYLELNVNPNAYTSGDTKPFITLTSGLINAVPKELLPVVIAHECGHIACRHVLYLTMGSLILNGAFAAASGTLVGKLLSAPLQMAFSYWMRCSEFSADRAAAAYCGSAEPVIDMCMRLAGYDKNIDATASRELFMRQAEEYRGITEDSKWDKTLEFLLIRNMSHPLNAVRAYECDKWAKEERL